MKKRITALLMALLILAGVSVVSTSAAARYSIWVGGVQVTSDNASDVLGDGTVRYAANENCLYLKNARISGEVLVEDMMSAGIYAGGMDLTIRFSGNNRITDCGASEWSIGVGVEEGNLSIVGEDDSASLAVYSSYSDGYSMGVYTTYNYDDILRGGDFIVDGGNVTVGYMGGETLIDATSVGVYCCDMTIKSGNVVSEGGATSSGDSIGVKAYGDIYVEGGSLTAKGKAGVASIGIAAESVEIIDDVTGDLASPGGGYLIVSEGAVVTAEASTAQVHSFGISLARGLQSNGTVIATSGDTTYPAGPEAVTTSYGIVGWGLASMLLRGGTVVAKSGYAYDSCGINAIWDKTLDYVIAGDVIISGNCDVTAISEGGYLYSDGLYVGGNFKLESGSLTAKGGPVTAESEYYPESGAIFAEGDVYILGGVLTASASEVTQEEGSDVTIYTSGTIQVDDELEIKGGKLLNGDEVSYIMQDSFDAPVVISAKSLSKLGDVNFDGDINIKDATAIQKHLALLEVFGEEALALADFNEDGGVSIKDATAIQKFIAGLEY